MFVIRGARTADKIATLQRNRAEASTMSFAHSGSDDEVMDATTRRLEVRVDDGAAGDWDELISRFDDSTYDQTAAFSDLRWGKGRVSRLILTEGGDIVAPTEIELAGARFDSVPEHVAGYRIQTHGACFCQTVMPVLTRDALEMHGASDDLIRLARTDEVIAFDGHRQRSCRP